MNLSKYEGFLYYEDSGTGIQRSYQRPRTADPAPEGAG